MPSSGNYAAGTYKPTAYQGSSSTDTFTSSSSGLYNVPGSFTYAAPQGTGTFATTFSGTNPNGTWSLFFDSTVAASAEGAQSGWCLNFTENPVAVTVDENHSGTGTSGDFIQGETGAQITTVVNVGSGNGPTGDPLGTNPLKVVDTLNSAFTYQSSTGTGWSCSAVGQTVTCTNDSAIAAGAAYPTLTLNVNVSGTATGSISNSSSVSGAGITSTTSNTDSIVVEGSATLAISKSHTGTFTQGSTGTWTLVVSNTASTGSTSGTVTVSDTLPTGYTLSSSTSTSSLFNCSGVGAAVTCTGTPGIAAGGSNTITLTVNIPANSPTSVSNTASVWGGGDSVHNSSGTAAVSNTDTVSVIATTTTTAANESATVSASSQSVTLSATVTSNAGTVNGGTVTFTVMNGGTTIGTPTTSGTVSNGNASVSYTLPAGTTVGTYTIVASYNGTSSFTSSSDNTHTLTVTAPATTTTAANQTATFSVGAQSVTLSASVTSGAGTVNAGTVTFTVLNGATPVGTPTTSGTVAAGTASVSYTLPAGVPAGTYTIQAIYNGSANFAASADASHFLNVTAAGSTTVASNASVTYNAGSAQSIALSATVVSPAGLVSEGSVTFTVLNGATPVGTPVTGSASAGAASVTFSLPAGSAVGSYTIQAVYVDAAGNFAGSSDASHTLIVNPVPAFAVLNTNDSGTGSLRAALASATTAGGGNITFDAGAFGSGATITLQSGLTIPGNTTITGLTSGSGATLRNLVTVSGNSTYRIFQVNSGANGIAIANLNLENGSGTGGAINNNGGSLTVTQSTFSLNAGSTGGAIWSSGTVTVSDSTFQGNTVTNGGGAISNSNGTLTVSDSTFSLNSAATGGGAIWNSGTENVTGSTFYRNAATSAGGGALTNVGGALTLQNSIFSQNSASTTGAAVWNSGIVTESNNDFDSNVVFGFTTSGTDVTGAADLAVLGSYGGPTQTLIPLPGSAAICAITPSSAIGTDQRGLPRTTVYGSTNCQDLGAVQTNYSVQFTTNPPASVNAGTNFGAAVTLSESGAPVNLSGVTIPLTLNASAGTLSGGSASTTNGVATYTALQVNGGGTGDTLTANLLLTAGSAAAQETASATSGSFDVTVLAPTISMAFSPSTILASGTSTLTVTLGNPNTALTLTNVHMSSTLPAGLTGQYPQTISCSVASMSGSGLANLSIQDSSLAPGQSCTANFIVQAGTASPVVYTDAAQVTATQWTGTAPTTTATLTVGLPATHFTVTAPATATAGTPLNFTVTALDSTNAVVPLYSGTVHFTTTDPNAVLPADATLTSGTGTFSATLKTPGAQTITATDTVNGSLTGTSGSITMSAPSFVVTNTNDSGTGSLRAALASAASNGSGTITFDPTVFSASNTAAQNTITLSSGLTIPANTTIVGATTGSGASLRNLVTVSGNNLYRIFVVNTGVTGSSIANLNLTNGYITSQGGAIDVEGSLAVVNCTFANNSAGGYATGAGNGGGAIYLGVNAGTLTISGSTFSGNTSAPGGAITTSAGSVTISNSTFTGNAATDSKIGGAIFIGNNGPMTVTITDSTFSGNSAASGGAIANYGTLTVSNSILAGDSGGECYEGSTGCPTNGANGNVVDASGTLANLAPLGNYGGPTQTVIPLPGSTAICSGLKADIPNGVTTDQRGYPDTNTTYPGYSAGTPCVDAGAVQTNYAISFTAPASNVPAATAMTPAPAVTLDESGAPFTGAAVTIPLTLTSNPSGATLSGGTASTSGGVATYLSLSVNEPGTGNELTATLVLNSSPAVSLSAVSGTFNVSKATPTIGFVPNPASQTYGTAIASGSLNATATYNNTTVPGTFVYTTTVGANPVTLVAGTTVLPAGSYTITATFTPSNATVYTGGSATASYMVNGAALTITASSATMIYGSTVPTISPSYSGFVNGDTAASLTAPPTCSTTATSLSPVGSYPSSCSGAVDANYVIGYTAGSVTVGQAASVTTVGLSSTSITPGQSETISVTVASSTTGTPTGTVGIYDGATLLTTVTLVNGKGSYTTTTLAPGMTHVITAVYSGDTNFTGSTSTANTSVTVAPLDFTMTISGPSTATVIPGQSVSYQVTVTPLYGSYAGTVNFAVTGLPSGATVTFSPSSIAANGGPQTITVTITAPPATASNRMPQSPSPTRRAAPLALACLLLFGLGAMRRRGHAVRRLLAIVLLFAGGAAATMVSGCGGNSGFFAQAPQNYNVTINATASNLHHSVTVSLNVQ